MKNKSGVAYLIPVAIAEEGNRHLSVLGIELLQKIKFWCTENGKTFRHFLRSIHPDIELKTHTYLEYNKHNESYDIGKILRLLHSGNDIGIVSESGIPSVADPGSILVKKLHQNSIKVIPISGPNSILMALMASGLNGQNFQFHGYLPIDSAARVQKLKALEITVQKNNSAEIFMETPYRNVSMIETVLRTLSSQTGFCIAANITGANEFIKTMTIKEWQKFKLPDLHKVPSIFILGKL